MPTLITGDALTKAKTGAVAWLHEQLWISSKVVPVIEKAINELQTWHSPASNATLYRNIRADIKELSSWLEAADIKGPIRAETVASRQADIMCLCAEMIIYIAMVPDHTISSAMLSHPFKDEPKESSAVSWWAMFCAEFNHVLEKTPHKDYIFLNIVMSRRASKATHTQHKIIIKKLHELLKKWDELYKKPRTKSLYKDNGKKDNSVVNTAHTTSSPQPAKRKAEHQNTAPLEKKRVAHIAHNTREISEDAVLIVGDTATQNKPSYEQLQTERDAAVADMARMKIQIKSLQKKYIKYKHLSKDLDHIFVRISQMHMRLVPRYQNKGEQRQQKQNPEKQQNIERQDDREWL